MQAHEGLLASSSLGPSIPHTVEQGLGPQSGLQLGFFIGWSRGFSEGVEEFLKFCLHSDRGLSRALSSLLILIWDFLPWGGLCCLSDMGFSAEGNSELCCLSDMGFPAKDSLQFFSLKFSSYSQGPKWLYLC